MTISRRDKPFSAAETTLNLIYPPLNLTDMALIMSSMVDTQLNEMHANGTDENNIEEYVRQDRLNIFSGADTHAVEVLLLKQGALARLEPGECFKAEAAGAPVSPDRAKNVPVAFASGNFIIDRNRRAVELTGVSGLQSQATNFQELVDISQRGMLDHMKKSGTNISAGIEVFPPSACPQLK